MAHYLQTFRIFSLILILSAFVLGCGKSGNVRWVQYDETYCADRWDYNINNEKLKENITTYLKDQGIKVLELEIFSDRTAETCRECTCKSGRRIKCKIKKRDVKEAKTLGFYED